MKVGLVQLNVTDDPAVNLPVTRDLVRQGFADGADLVCTPEVTGFITTDADRQAALVKNEAEDPTLAALRTEAVAAKGWLSIGSLAVQGQDRFANRSFLIAPDGQIAARYDKIHMFDAVVSDTEKYAESRRYRPGTRAVVAQTPCAKIGMTICFDLRFPHLFHALAAAGAEVILVPSAFSPVTGAAHWHTLLRARAIETGCFIVAAAQTGTHVTEPRRRVTFGHGLIVDPWGQVILDMADKVGVDCAEIDLAAVEAARARIPTIELARSFEGP